MRTEDFIPDKSSVVQTIKLLESLWDSRDKEDLVEEYIDLSIVLQEWVGYGVPLDASEDGKVTVFLKEDARETAVSFFKRFMKRRRVTLEVVQGIVFEAPMGGIAGGGGVGLSPGAGITGVAKSGGMAADGTLGCFLSGANTRYLLSTNHVIAFNELFGDTDVRSDGKMVGKNVRGVRIRSSSNNRVDAAVAEVDGAIATENTLTEIVTGADVRAKGAIKDVQKIGAGSGSTAGTIAYMLQRVTMGVPSCRIAEATFCDQMLVESGVNAEFSTDGDSGAIASCVEAGQQKAVGMLIGNGVSYHERRSFTMVTPIENILQEIEARCKLKLALGGG